MGEPLTRLLVDFARRLRDAGVPVGSGDVLAYCSGAARLDPTDLVDLYWAGRTTLITKHEQIPLYNKVFRAFFLGETDPLGEAVPELADVSPRSESTLAVPATEPGDDHDDQALLGLMASDLEILKHKSFAACTPDELAALRRIMARLRVTPPRRRSRRTVAARSGRRPDVRRAVRRSMRLAGEPAEMFWRRRKVRLRPLILILDVSGSMADYSRTLLQFAHSARRAAARVEVFCFGTRLTRITRELERRRPDEALERAARAVVDWEGGTRIGDSLDTFVRRWGRRGTGRGGVVVICSDGLDRGDPAVLAGAMERLARLCHRIVWVNPHQGDDPAYRPATLGLLAAAPHVDRMVSGHDLRSLERLATMLAEVG